ncbi:MAG: TonB-dependent receptor [Flavobacteriales bacterium]
MKNIILILFCLFSVVSFAQQKGVVTNIEKEPLAMAEVYLYPLGILTQTDSNGEFNLNIDLPPKSVLVFSKEGYQTFSYQTDNNEPSINITLQRLHVEINEVEVSAINHQLSSNQVIALQSLSINGFNDNTLNLVERLSHIPGVYEQSTGTGINKVTVRGLSGMRVVTYLNGARVENQQWGGDHGLGFTDLGLGKVELIKGPASIMFGADALAGALYFVDDSYVSSGQPELKVVSNFESALMRFNNQIISKWAKDNFRMNTYAEYGTAADYRMPNGDFLFNSRFDNLALKTAMGYSTQKWLVNIRYQFNRNVLGIPAHSHDAEPTLDQLSSSNQNRYETRPTQFTNNHLLSLQNTFFINDNTLKMDLAHSINKLQEFEAWTIAEYDTDLSSTQFNTTFTKPLSQATKWTLGSQSAIQMNTNNASRSQLLPDAEIKDIGVFSNLDFNKNDWSLLFGVRYDYREVKTISDLYANDFNALSSSFGFSKSINDHKLRLSYSSAFRTPHFSELLSDGVHHGTQRYEIGNPDLKEEKGNQLDFTYEWANEHLGLIINPFFNHVDDFIFLSPQDSMIKGMPLYLYQQLDHVQLKGLEMNLHYHPHFLHQLHIEESISIMDGQTSDGHYLPLIPANTFQTRAKYYFLNDNVLNCRELSLEHIYHASQQNVAKNESPSEDYALINASALFSSKSKKINLSLGVRNLLNVSYIPHLSRLKSYEIPHVGRSYYLKLCLTL